MYVQHSVRRLADRQIGVPAVASEHLVELGSIATLIAGIVFPVTFLRSSASARAVAERAASEGRAVEIDVSPRRIRVEIKSRGVDEEVSEGRRL